MRLVKYLAHSGVASRRAAERLIADGRVAIGGETVTDPARDVGEGAAVTFDGAPVTPEVRETWIVNKPLEVTSTAREPGRRRAVTDLVATELRLYPVGRLDADSTGLILLTNDGELANLLTHPRYGVPKSYRAILRRPIDDRDLARLREGVELEDGPSAPAEVTRSGPAEVVVTIREGRNRQVRRMFEAVGNRVAELERTRFGSLELGNLGQGEARGLSEAELERLWKDARAMQGGEEDRR